MKVIFNKISIKKPALSLTVRREQRTRSATEFVKKTINDTQYYES